MRRAALALASALALAACGSQDDPRTFPPAATPAPSPPLAAAPAGRVIHDPARVRALLAPPVVRAAGRTFALDARRSRLRSGARSVAVPLQPTGLAALGLDGPIAVVGARARRVALYDARTLRELARTPAGLGPTTVAALGGRLYVADTAGRVLLVLTVRPELRVVRRIALPGAPYGTAADPRRGRLWVTITDRDRVLLFAATARPVRLQGFDTVRQPDAVTVDPRSGAALVAGRAGDELQLVDPGPD